MQGRTATHHDPQWDTTKTAQEAGNTQLTGHFRWSRPVLGPDPGSLGQRFTEPLAGRLPPGPGGSAGLWLANQLCELVQISATPEGTAVRLHHRL